MSPKQENMNHKSIGEK